jgi:hypothetical protein
MLVRFVFNVFVKAYCSSVASLSNAVRLIPSAMSPRHHQGMFIVADVDFPEVYPEMIADVGAPLHQPEDQPPVEADLAGLPDDEFVVAGPVEDHMHHIMHIDLFADDNEWLTAVFRDAALEKQPAIRVLEVTEDGKVVLLMPAYHAEGRLLGRDAARTHPNQQTGRLNPFAWVYMHPVAFGDGLALCCTCNNPGCNRTSAVAALFQQELSFPEQQHRTYAETFGTQAALCRCATTALQAGLGLHAEGNGAIDDMEENGIWFWYQQLDPVSAPPFTSNTAPQVHSCLLTSIHCTCSLTIQHSGPPIAVS